MDSKTIDLRSYTAAGKLAATFDTSKAPTWEMVAQILDAAWKLEKERDSAEGRLRWVESEFGRIFANAHRLAARTYVISTDDFEWQFNGRAWRCTTSTAQMQDEDGKLREPFVMHAGICCAPIEWVEANCERVVR